MSSSQPGRNTVLALILFVALGMVWGATPTLAKIGVQGGIPPIGYLFWLCTGAGLLLLALGAWRGALPPLIAPYLRYYAFAGIGNVAIPQAAQVTSLKYVPLSAYVLIITLSPLITYGLSLVVGIERFVTRRFIGVWLGLFGALLILVPQASLPSPDMLPWMLLAVVTPTFYAVSNVYIGVARPPAVDSLALAAAMNIATALSLAPFVVLTDSFYIPLQPLTGADYALIAHVITTGLGSLLFFEIIRLAGPVYLSQVAYFITLYGMLSGVIVFGEVPSPWLLAALVAILGGLALVTWPLRRATPTISAAPE